MQPKSLNQLYQDLAETIGAILDHEDCPADVANHFVHLVCDLDNETSFHTVGARARALLPVCLDCLTEDSSEDEDAGDAKQIAAKAKGARRLSVQTRPARRQLSTRASAAPARSHPQKGT